MKTDSQISGAVFQDIVVDLYVRVEPLLRIDASLLHALDRGIGAEEGEGRIVKLDVSAAGCVKSTELFSIRVYQIGEVRV